MMREVPLWPRLALRGASARVAFLPSTGRSGAALLRIYNVAAALERRGWACLVLPPGLTLAQRRRLLGVFAPGVIVMQGARHPLNRPALYPGQPIVYDMDDADFHLDHLAAPVRAAMGQVAHVVAGSAYIADWALAEGARHASVIWTTTPPAPRPAPPQAVRGPVVAWGQSRPMDYRDEAALVRRVMAGVAARHPGVTLRLYDRRPGDDPAFAAGFAAPGLRVEWCQIALYRDYLARFDDVAVGLAPLEGGDPFHRGKSFGKLLACFDRGVPVVASPFGEPLAFLTPDRGCLARSEADWVRAVSGLLTDPARRQMLADSARQAFLTRLTPAEAAVRMDGVLRQVMFETAGPGEEARLSSALGAV